MNFKTSRNNPKTMPHFADFYNSIPNNYFSILRVTEINREISGGTDILRNGKLGPWNSYCGTDRRDIFFHYR